MAGFGMLLVGPSQHMWFNFIARILLKRDMVTTFKKLSMGQVLYGSCVKGVFFSYNAALQELNSSSGLANTKFRFMELLFSRAIDK
ncbi:hypothetical protein Vadar_000313 [Vaccinium darrowii]|uniref:Uncharacterized protein n=1 Tax=Vaccinium darrowii TaxID=229202 RepID=A0ACB7XVQ6_9ERIC|nr:hypothetical protein Vadar_000313 [Vaccinium darrowii]